MSRRFLIASGVVGPAFDSIEQAAQRRHDRERRIPHTPFILTDYGLYPTRDSAGLRAAADNALTTELQASLDKPC